jgi:hypothetical protein
VARRGQSWLDRQTNELESRRQTDARALDGFSGDFGFAAQKKAPVGTGA